MKDLERWFKGLADQTRLRILNLLMHGELCVCDLQHLLESSQPNVSRHLAYLKNSGLVLDRREGPRMYYRLAEPTNGAHKLLFASLRELFRTSAPLGEDSRKLRKAIGTGSCTVSTWRPDSALVDRAAVVEAAGFPAEVEKVSDFQAMARLGVLSTPAVAVDGILKCSGRIPGEDEVKSWLQAAISSQA